LHPAAGLVLGAGVVCGGARAIVFLATDDPAHNTTPPAGDLADSGWQWQGNWRGFVGTPIAPEWFITARHLAGGVGELFHFAGESYRTTAVFRDTASDLALWRVCGRFPAFAPLYGGADEVGRECVLFGRGRGRGALVVVTNEAGEAVLRGWEWGGGNGTLRWGRNRVAALKPYGETPDGLLSATFDENGGPDEAMLTGGDSGGGLFIQREGRWELAGVAFAVDGPFRLSADGESLHAALFDMAGLFVEEDGVWTRVPRRPEPQPAALYASRIAARREWILATIAANPEPADPPELQAAVDVTGPYVTVAAAADPAAQTLRVPAPAGPAFYRLASCRPTRVLRIERDRADLVLYYEQPGEAQTPTPNARE
jgi:hypothetical protein